MAALAAAAPWRPAAPPATGRAPRPRAPPTSTGRAREAGGTHHGLGLGARRSRQVAADFEAKYPNVKVNLVNAGTGNDQYTALQNAIKAGSGVPDVAQIEYYALPQFALAKSLDRPDRRTAPDELEGTFTPGPWNSVQRRRRHLRPAAWTPGPMALFYNKEVFDKYEHRGPDHLGRVRRRGARSCTRPTRRRTSPTTPATPASPPA